MLSCNKYNEISVWWNQGQNHICFNFTRISVKIPPPDQAKEENSCIYQDRRSLKKIKNNNKKDILCVCELSCVYYLTKLSPRHVHDLYNKGKLMFADRSPLAVSWSIMYKDFPPFWTEQSGWVISSCIGSSLGKQNVFYELAVLCVMSLAKV